MTTLYVNSDSDYYVRKNAVKYYFVDRRIDFTTMSVDDQFTYFASLNKVERSYYIPGILMSRGADRVLVNRAVYSTFPPRGLSRQLMNCLSIGASTNYNQDAKIGLAPRSLISKYIDIHVVVEPEVREDVDLTTTMNVSNIHVEVENIRQTLSSGLAAEAIDQIVSVLTIINAMDLSKGVRIFDAGTGAVGLIMPFLNVVYNYICIGKNQLKSTQRMDLELVDEAPSLLLSISEPDIAQAWLRRYPRVIISGSVKVSEMQVFDFIGGYVSVKSVVLDVRKLRTPIYTPKLATYSWMDFFDPDMNYYCEDAEAEAFIKRFLQYGMNVKCNGSDGETLPGCSSCDSGTSVWLYRQRINMQCDMYFNYHYGVMSYRKQIYPGHNSDFISRIGTLCRVNSHCQSDTLVYDMVGAAYHLVVSSTEIKCKFGDQFRAIMVYAMRADMFRSVCGNVAIMYTREARRDWKRYII